MHINMQGRAGAGKGKQAGYLVEDFSFPYVESGGKFRRDLKENRPIGVQAKEYMAAGDLVPDEVLFRGLEIWVKEEDPEERSEGLITDGLPRTLDQAVNFADYMLKRGNGTAIDYVFVLNCSADTARRRIYGRMNDENGKDYNAFFDNRIEIMQTTNVNGFEVPIVAYVDGKKLTKRKDDTDFNTIERRFSIFENETQFAIDYLRGEIVNGRRWNHGPLPVVIDIDAELSADKVREQILASQLYASINLSR
ncbi:nucleoside monophosphate kinase [Candidatus Woesearchaeota archaeon]|nr:nucleoside monophosphate kinase [Candidatus Woesearchaeota archaeon]